MNGTPPDRAHDSRRRIKDIVYADPSHQVIFDKGNPKHDAELENRANPNRGHGSQDNVYPTDKIIDSGDNVRISGTNISFEKDYQKTRSGA